MAEASNKAVPITIPINLFAFFFTTEIPPWLPPFRI